MNKFVAWSSDEENLYNSSSGGIFFEMAKKMLEENGKVVGVIMQELKAKYILSQDLEEIKQMRGSKYIPSNPANVIKEIKDKEEKILFVGLPCHIEAVKKICNTKKIILVDLSCYGLPKDNSYFEKHIKKISKGRSIKSVSFRNKKNGWSNSQRLYIVFSNGETYDKDKTKDDYYISYLNKSIIKNSCKSCKYNQKGIGDITIGDFWAVPPSLKNEKGTSIVQINTKKGKEFFNSITSITVKKVRFYHYLNKDRLKDMSLKRIAYRSLKLLGLR